MRGFLIALVLAALGLGASVDFKGDHLVAGCSCGARFDGYPISLRFLPREIVIVHWSGGNPKHLHAIEWDPQGGGDEYGWHEIFFGR